MVVSIAVIVIVAMATRRHPNTRPMHPPAEETVGIFNNYLPAMYVSILVSMFMYPSCMTLQCLHRYIYV